MSDGIKLLADSARGIYIPQYAESALCDGWVNWDNETRAILACGPENPEYWDAWCEVLDRLEYTDNAGNVWRLYQDDDLFAVCSELLTDSEYESFHGEARC